jgi:hypothetical protein
MYTYVLLRILKFTRHKALKLKDTVGHNGMVTKANREAKSHQNAVSKIRKVDAPQHNTLKSAKCTIMDQSREDLVDEIPGRGSNGEAGGVLLDEAGSEASQTLDDVSNGNDTVGEDDSFCEALDEIAPAEIDEDCTPSSE